MVFPEVPQSFGGPWGAMGGQQCYLVLIEYLHGPPWYVPAIFGPPSNGGPQSTIDTAIANSPPTRILAPPYCAIEQFFEI